jgi:two-component system cell cycle sensor histidine kinase/response regulator CckA
MPQGGSLIIETSNTFLDDEYCATHPEVRPGSYVMLGVTDTGTGMTPDVQRRIFEPFFTTKPTGSGTGLGLATVHGMVRQIGGWIWVYSEPGSGATFKIYFPVTEEAVVRSPHTVVKTDVRGRETILLVEDQEEVRTLAMTVLERCGYRVLSATGGEEALSLAKGFGGTIHLLLTDIVMPGMNGRALASQLVAERPLRVLFMSGYTENAIAHRGILDAGVDYIQKPFTPESLAEKVREVLASKGHGATQ